MKLRTIEVYDGMYIVNGCLIATTWEGFMQFCIKVEIFECLLMD